MNFNDYQQLVSSEKLVLATIEASKRLMGWVVHSGSVYKLENVSLSVLLSVEDSGNAYTEVSSIGAVTSSKYYFDRSSSTIYIRTTGSDHPNGRFIVGTFRLFFSNIPITLPYDLDSGFEVYWEASIQSTSDFGVEIDTVNQVSEAIEGAGTLTLFNDQEFWPENYDLFTFENKSCAIYTYNRLIDDPTEAKLIFLGKIQKKTFSSQTIKFTLQDLISEFRTSLPLSNIVDLGGRNESSLDLAKQRMILGRVYGHIPINLDNVLDGYPIDGTIEVTFGSVTVTGSGTDFLDKLSPDDALSINGVEYTIADVVSDTELTLSEEYAIGTQSGLPILVIPNLPKKWTNRIWNVAGHATKEPTTLTTAGCTTTRILVESTVDMFEGDDIYIGVLGSGEVAIIERVINGNLLKLTQSLEVAPNAGVTITRPAIQNLRINDSKLTYYRDYTYEAETATLTLRTTAEANASVIRQLSTTLNFANGSRVVSGTGLKDIIQPGYQVGVIENSDFFEVLSVSDTGLMLREPANFTDIAIGRYKPLQLDADNDVLNCDMFGRTLDGTSSGTFIRNGSTMIKTLLNDLGLSSILDSDSFAASAIDAPADLGLVVPVKYGDTTTPIYRDIINNINKSINGSIVQTNAFNLKHFIVEPFKDHEAIRFFESDISGLKTDSTSENIVKTSIVNYRPKEYNYLTQNASINTQQKSSDIATHVLKIDRSKTFETKIVEERDAEIYANRWSFLLEGGTSTISFTTKLQGVLLEVGDIIDVTHRKLFVRKGGLDKRRILLIEKIKKNGLDVLIQAVDLSNSFNRIASFNDYVDDYGDSTDHEKLYGGYFTDQYGLIDDEQNSFGINLFY